MLDPTWFLSTLSQQGITCVTGVPCSYVSGLYSTLETGAWPYLSATSEGESAAIAAGTWLAGSQAITLCQNSGLGNMTNPLSSLIWPYQIPVVVGVSRRGWPTHADEPQHALMGEITPALLDLLCLSTEPLSAAREVALGQLAAAAERCSSRRSTAFVFGKDVFDNACAVAASPSTSPAPAGEQVRIMRGGPRPTREAMLGVYLGMQSHRATVSTTGYTSRELYRLDDRGSHFYMFGSMGCAAAIAVGLAASGRAVTVLDGDGALLMRLGTLATVGRYVRTPFVHLVLDNGCHESTGGQRTQSPYVNFATAALACGYRRAWWCDGIDAVHEALKCALAETDGPVMIHCLIRPGVASPLPRPAQPLPDLALRFRDHVSSTATP